MAASRVLTDMFLLHALAGFAASSVFIEAFVAFGYHRFWEALFRTVAAVAMYGAAFLLEKAKLWRERFQ